MSEKTRIEPMSHETRAKQVGFKGQCDDLRYSIRNLETGTRNLSGEQFLECAQAFEGQHEEIAAQLNLAVRALEEARMRLGKAIQYSEDGVSIHDRIG